jgi:predicted molibdopterin-dependent oxidoreductase YjgC
MSYRRTVRFSSIVVRFGATKCHRDGSLSQPEAALAGFEPWSKEQGAASIGLLETHPDHAEERGIKEGDLVRLASRVGTTTLHAHLTDRMAPSVVYTTFHHPDTQANVITTEYSDWATNCPEYKVTAVQVTPSNGPSDWQQSYAEHSRVARRIELMSAK